MRSCLLFTALLAFFIQSSAQSVAMDTMATTGAEAAAIAYFHQVTKAESPIYTGPEHMAYPAKLIGSPYFGGSWQRGSVLYDGILYTDVPLRYDQVRDKLVVQHFNTFYELELISEKVGRFTIGDHHFIYLPSNASTASPSPGFYEVLSAGKLSLLAKTEKEVEEFIESNEIRRRIKQATYYYALQDGRYMSIRQPRSLLNLFGDKKADVQQYLRKNKIKFKRRSQEAMKSAVDYYNQISR